MALARIITRSQVCARELATDLVARGYVVEIVTPDAVPDNRADLELRVEENPGNQLVASVLAHDGPRSASFEFRHQLRAPMRDFLRKMQETTEVVYLSEEPASFIAEPNTEAAELPATTQQRKFEAVSAPGPVLREPRSDPGSTDLSSTDSRSAGPSPQQGAPVLPELEPSRLAEMVAVGASHLAKEAEASEAASTLSQPLPATANLPPAMVHPRRDPRTRKRPAHWQWRAGLAFTSMVSLAVLFGLGARHSEKVLTPVSGASSIGKVAVPSIDAPTAAAAQWGWNWDDTPKDSTAINAEDAVVNASIVNKTIVDKTIADTMTIDKTGRSRAHDDSSIAPDTVTYFDGRRQPIAPQPQRAKRLARPEPAPHKRPGGVVAANTVTYLNKPIPKPAK